jgi:hypothetical protein
MRKPILNIRLNGLKINKFRVTEISIILFWYLSMFPGRLGFDGSAAIRMIQQGQSTDWWTASFFWFLRIFTMGGESIYLASLVSYLLLAFSVKYLVFALPTERKIRRRVYLIMLVSPIVSVFGLTVSHDALQVAGILILIGFHIREMNNENENKKNAITILSIAYLGLLTTHLGLAIIALDILIHLSRRLFRRGTLLAGIVILIYVVSSFGITKHDPSANTSWMVADLKCIAQHAEARLSVEDWNFLESIAPKSEWQTSLSCTTVDEPVGTLVSRNSEALLFSSEFTLNYLSVIAKNPAVVAMAHIQRSRGALPPPFFQGPDNQVELDPSIPIGLGTNIALQNGTELLHPSVDEPSVKIKFAPLKPLEIIGQGLIFIVNQASWFWGWGGLWLWPTFYFFITRFRKTRLIARVKPLFPVILLHGLLVAIGPAPLPRYVMAAVVAGVTCSIVMIFEWLHKTKAVVEPST